MYAIYSKWLRNMFTDFCVLFVVYLTRAHYVICIFMDIWILVFSPFCWVFRYLVHFICFIWFNFDGFRLRLMIILFVRGFNLLSTSRFGTSACQRNRKRFESLALVRVWKIFSFQLLHIFMYIYITGYWWKMCEDSLADWALTILSVWCENQLYRGWARSRLNVIRQWQYGKVILRWKPTSRSPSTQTQIQIHLQL